MTRYLYKLWAMCGAMFTLLTLLIALISNGESTVSLAIGGLGFICLTCYFAVKGFAPSAERSALAQEKKWRRLGDAERAKGNSDAADFCYSKAALLDEKAQRLAGMN